MSRAEPGGGVRDSAPPAALHSVQPVSLRSPPARRRDTLPRGNCRHKSRNSEPDNWRNERQLPKASDGGNFGRTAAAGQPKGRVSAGHLSARLMVTGGMTVMAMVGSRPCVTMHVTTDCGKMPHLRGAMTWRRNAVDAAGPLRTCRRRHRAWPTPARWHGTATLGRNVGPADAAGPFSARTDGSTVLDHLQRDRKAPQRA